MVEDLPEEAVGNIIMADESQAEPHSGIIVAVGIRVGGAKVGDRAYYRPFAPHVSRLGPESDGLVTHSLHHKDILAYEEDPK